MMGTCKTCKWWNPNNWGNANTHKLCGHPKNVNSNNTKVFPEDGTVVVGYQWETGPDFGCIHHEEASDD